MTHFRSLYFLLPLLTVSILEVRPGLAQERYVYWVGAIDSEETRGNVIFRYTLEGEIVDTLVQAAVLSPDESRYFYYVTVDTLRDKIYWTDSGFEDSTGVVFNGAIVRSSLHGDNPEPYLGGIVCGVGSLTDIELDMFGDTLYWAESSDCPDRSLHRTDLSSPDPFSSQLPTNGTYRPSAIELDIPQKMLYWTNLDFFVTKPHGILRAPLDDTATDEYIIQGSVCDIALSHFLEKIYWTPCDSSVIRRANLDGSDSEIVVTTEGDPTFLAIDDMGQKIYWTEPNGGRIRRANLDGAEIEDLISGLVVPTSLALSFGSVVNVGIAPEETLREKLKLFNIYPNPVGESASIEFALDEVAQVRLEIYNSVGRRIEILDSRMYPTGKFRIDWDTANHASGVYFCRITTGNTFQAISFIIKR